MYGCCADCPPCSSPHALGWTPATCDPASVGAYIGADGWWYDNADNHRLTHDEASQRCDQGYAGPPLPPSVSYPLSPTFTPGQPPGTPTPPARPTGILPQFPTLPLLTFPTLPGAARPTVPATPTAAPAGLSTTTILVAAAAAAIAFSVFRRGS